MTVETVQRIHLHETQYSKPKTVYFLLPLAIYIAFARYSAILSMSFFYDLVKIFTKRIDNNNNCTGAVTQSNQMGTSTHHIATITFRKTGRGSSIGSEFAWHACGPEFDPHVRHILSWRLGHENISTAILPLPLIQEEQLSVTGERMCTKYWLTT